MMSSEVALGLVFCLFIVGVFVLRALVLLHFVYGVKICECFGVGIICLKLIHALKLVEGHVSRKAIGQEKYFLNQENDEMEHSPLNHT